ncbi:glycosyltransferase family 4 protein [Brevibacterium casei]|uniref:glycosyltransferase family 4 protein n=1 Tax=Brevibacterium TaxID=1696 RepID=UPI001BA6433B|nr:MULTISPECIES: glycosyltransferase family 4 protein [Brevibacterium]MCT1767503.1 glycosyltransferase family 4 protein [Brevibacterium casei]
MNPLFLGRQIINAIATTTAHVREDRVFFGMQLARRLPSAASKVVGRILGHLPDPASRTAAAWLLGHESHARELVLDYETTRPSRLLGEIALNLGQFESASRIADSVAGGASLRSRILWSDGRIDEAIAVLRDGGRRRRLVAEKRSLEPGWWPEVSGRILGAHDIAGHRPESPTSLHVLTNSLPHTRSGYAYRSHLILKTLQDSGHTVMAATRPSYPMTIGRLSSTPLETVDGVEYLRHVPLLPTATPTARLSQQARWIADRVAQGGVDVLHTTTHYVNGLATGAAARATGIPWVYEVRGVLEETWAASGGGDAERVARRASQRFAMMREKEIEVARAADAVITLGETMRAHLVDNGIPADAITLIPNSVSEAVVGAEVTRRPAELRTELGLPEGGVWVGTAASIVGYEGLDDLVDAVAIARAQGVDLRLLIAGDGTALPSLRERARPLGDNAVFTGRVSQKSAIAHQLALDAIVVPRKDEPVCRLVTPIKPVEAMGLARPVVISDLPALRELVPASAGLWTEPENPQCLAAVLAELALDATTRESLGNNGREHVLSTRRWKDIGQRYGEVYSRLVGANAK